MYELMTRLAAAQPWHSCSFRCVEQNTFEVGRNDFKITFLPTLRVARTEINVSHHAGISGNFER
jgi:hypothetical protein